MTRLIPTLCITLALVACAPAPLMTQSPVTIGPGELHNYWVPAQRSSKVDVPVRPQKEGIPGHVVVAYMIDSQGMVINPRVIESEPAGVYDEAALNFIRTQTFTPARANEARTPVRTRTQIDFSPDISGHQDTGN